MKLRRLLHSLWRFLWRSAGLFLLILTLRQSVVPAQEPYYQLAARVPGFDYVGWTADAVFAKLGVTAAGTTAMLTEAERSQFVRAYFDDLAAVMRLEAEIERIYADPSVRYADGETLQQRAQREAQRASLAARQTQVEAILESQVSAVLVAEGFGIGGQLLPPVAMRFTGQTLLLVASPRDAITLEHALTVQPLSIDERVSIENRVQDDLNLSALIVPIGGMALYPAMVVESANLPWIVETFAHEWLHHYLMAFPLGYTYALANDPEARIINETTASIFGREVGRAVLARYYPDLLPPPPAPAAQTSPATPPPAFDYGAEMHITRVVVDELLAQGSIYEAEAYMETRRRLFLANGYRIRRLNQAFFAFYGGYQVAGTGAGGEDPTGAAVQSLRDQSASLHAWILGMRTITQRSALLTAASPE